MKVLSVVHSGLVHGEAAASGTCAAAEARAQRVLLLQLAANVLASLAADVWNASLQQGAHSPR